MILRPRPRVWRTKQQIGRSRRIQWDRHFVIWFREAWRETIDAPLREKEIKMQEPCRKNYPHAKPCGPSPDGDPMSCACGCAADDVYCTSLPIEELDSRR